MLSDIQLSDALLALGELLEDRSQSADVVLIGGGALLLTGNISRPTKDLDVVAQVVNGDLRRAEPFLPELQQAVVDVAQALNLAEDWLNPGPTDLLTFGLPKGMEQRWETRSYGALTARLASRFDQIHFKVYAAADHWPMNSKHRADLQALNPSTNELTEAARWCLSHDASEGFRLRLLHPLLLSCGVAAHDLP